MKKLVFLFLFLSVANKLIQAQITWNFTAATATGVPANITAGNVTQGSNNGTTTFLAAGSPVSSVYPGFSAGNNGNFSAKTTAFALTTSTYLQAVITPASGYWLNITGIKWGNFSLATTGPTTLNVYVSNDNFVTSTLVATSTVTQSATTWTQLNPTMTPYQGLTGSAVTIRIYASGGTGSTPAAGTANWRVDDLIITATVQNGTVGQIPKYTGPTTFTNSIISENNGKIGIATTTPATTLDVNGSITTNGGLLLKNAAPIQLWNATNGNMGVISSFDGGGFKLRPGAGVTSDVNILNNGNVGLGIETPTSKLHVNGDATVKGALYFDYANLTQYPSGQNWINFHNSKHDPTGQYFNGIDYINGSGQVNLRSGEGKLNLIGTNGLGIYKSTWNIDHYDLTSQLYVSPTSNVGIGTETPTSKLHVNGTITSTGFTMLTGAAANKILTSDANGVATWADAPAATNSAWGLNGNAGTTTSNFIGTTDAQRLVFKTNNIEKATILNNGNVGVGVTDPGHLLHVNGEVFVPNRYGSLTAGYYSSITETGGGYALVQGNNLKSSPINPNKLVKSASGGVGQYINMRYDRGIYFGTNVGIGDNPGTEYDDDVNARMAIGLNGNVGIGTTYPTSKLHIYGTDPSIFIEGDGSSYYPSLKIKSQVGEGFINNYGPSSYAAGMYLNATSLQNKYVGIGATPSGNVAQTADAGLVTFRVVATANQTNDIFKVIQNSATTPGSFTEANALVVNKDGKVLIGKMFDDNNVPLNIGEHKLAVNGSAIFTKAVVRLTSTWPDYVFAPTNKLPTLTEVEAYIAKHKHLQDVPSAAEVKEKGIDLGDNQAILLKKVEELTLYMIELNKKVEVLAKENEELKKKVNGDK